MSLYQKYPISPSTEQPGKYLLVLACDMCKYEHTFYMDKDEIQDPKKIDAFIETFDSDHMEDVINNGPLL